MAEKQKQKQKQEWPTSDTSYGHVSTYTEGRHPQYNDANESATQRAAAAADHGDWVVVSRQSDSPASITTDGGSSSLSSNGDGSTHPLPTGYQGISAAAATAVAPRPRQPCPIHGLALHDSHCSLHVHTTPTLHEMDDSSVDLSLESWAVISKGGFEDQAVFGAGAWADVEYPAMVGEL
jgi:hypothetical protein